MRRLIGWAVTLVVAAATVTVGAERAAAALPTPALPAPNAHGITVPSGELDQVSASGRLVQATMRTANVYVPGAGATEGAIDVNVRILLPATYDPGRAEPYDVLFLLHGGASDFLQWSEAGAIETTVGNRFDDGIIVMPDGGKAGWYADWQRETDGNFLPRWESFHIDQLVPWVDANFNTYDDADHRYIAGASMGGYGAMKYAGLHPDVFSAVASFSGGFDVDAPGARSRIINSVMGYGARSWTYGRFRGTYLVNLQDGEAVSTIPGHDALAAHRLEAVLGTYGTWDAANPVDLLDLGRYDGYSGRLALYSGQASGPWPEPTEPEIWGWNDDFSNRLAAPARDVSHRFCSGPGSHDFDDHWEPALQDFLAYLDGNAHTNCLDDAAWGAPRGA